MKNAIGIIGIFNDPDAVIHAAEQLRDKGYRRFDFHTPYPLHGLDEAMGIKPTILPYISLAAGFGGILAAIFLQWWTGAIDYPLIIGGKPFFAFEPSLPIIFELMVLFSATATTLAVFGLSRLPKWYSDYQHDPHFARSMDDAFVLTVDSGDRFFHHERTRELLESIGAKDIRIVERHE